MRHEIIPNSKYNSSLRLGAEWDDRLSYENGVTIAQIISESLNSISDPVLCEIEKTLGIENSKGITLADLGCLLHVRALEGNGTEIYIEFPSWCERYRQKILDVLSALIAGSFHEFIDQFEPEADWLFPISFPPAGSLSEIFEHNADNLKFSPTWILSSGVEKLSFMMFDMENKPELSIAPETKAALGYLLSQARDSVDYQQKGH